ncbi:MAG: GTP cyclohydrolase II, partial [Planctomycetes bacterium]|nr:GTP cyclohydrolase II [Planctomycetota bacterium]
SQRCDCGGQLHEAMRRIEAAGRGAVIYLRQEGRGIGLRDKLHAYHLQEAGMDTVQANEWLGYTADKRDYGIGAQICRDLGLRKIANMTNNPSKTNRLRVYGIEVVEQIPIEVEPSKHNERYLKTKRDKMGHVLRNL